MTYFDKYVKLIQKQSFSGQYFSLFSGDIRQETLYETVRIHRFGLYFPVLEQNIQISSINIRNQSEHGKIRSKHSELRHLSRLE